MLRLGRFYFSGPNRLNSSLPKYFPTKMVTLLIDWSTAIAIYSGGGKAQKPTAVITVEGFFKAQNHLILQPAKREVSPWGKKKKMPWEFHILVSRCRHPGTCVFWPFTAVPEPESAEASYFGRSGVKINQSVLASSLVMADRSFLWPNGWTKDDSVDFGSIL